MEVVDPPEYVQGTTAIEMLEQVPYVHGWPTSHAELKNVHDWMTVGTGIGHKLVEEHAEQVSSVAPIKEQWSEWEGFLDKEYMHYVQHTKFAWFACPVCQVRI